MSIVASHRTVQAGASQSATAPPPPIPPAETVATIVRDLAQALQGAAGTLRRAFSPDSRYPLRSQLNTAMALIRRVESLVPLIEKHPAPPDPQARYMPPCFVCGAKAGTHWAHDCPRTHRRANTQAVYDYHRKRILSYKKMDDPYRPHDPDDFAPARIPRCGVCGKGPGAHWPDDCPDNPIRHKMCGDRVVVPSEQPDDPRYQTYLTRLDTGLSPQEIDNPRPGRSHEQPG